MIPDERWAVTVANLFLYDVWQPIGPLYVSEEVAALAIKYHWAEEKLGRELRVRRVQ